MKPTTLFQVLSLNTNGTYCTTSFYFFINENKQWSTQKSPLETNKKIPHNNPQNEETTRKKERK
jgi:hypothetical protein